MELRHLRYFVAVAKEKHFRRAAANLHISQPPLSQQIQNLEEELGVKLLFRTGRNVELTSAGRVFLARSEKILQSVQEAVNDARRAKEGLVGKLGLGFIGSSAYSVLPQILSSFRSTVPEVELQLQQQSISEQINALLESKIDIGVLRLPFSDARFATQPIATERYAAALQDTHRLATSESLRMRDLADESFVLFPPQAGMMFNNIVHSFCRSAGFTPRVVQMATPMQTVIGLVSAGVGISVVPRSVRQVNMPHVVYVDLEDEHARTELALAWRASDTSDVLRVFLGVAQSVSHPHLEQAGAGVSHIA